MRIIAATNADLDQAVAHKLFRPDLLYRLKIFSITLPALRERPGDPELLAKHFVRRYSEQYQLAERPIVASDLAWLQHYSWPGNVRELESLVHRALVQSREKPTVELIHELVPVAHVTRGSPGDSRYPLGFQRAKAAAVHTFERTFIEQALHEAHGNVSAAARLSGKERRAFGKLMKKYGVTKLQFL